MQIKIICLRSNLLKNDSLLILMLEKDFFARPARIVAQELLGAELIHKGISGIIVETEAYYGEDDPASRAFGGKKSKINELMWEEAGTIMIYMVHSKWLLNIVTSKKNDAQAVLIRALMPKKGVKKMEKNRGKSGILLTNGPGKLTQALGIDKSLYGSIINQGIKINNTSLKPQIMTSQRIGVSRDVAQPLRFYIKDNPYVSKAKPHPKEVLNSKIFK